MKFIIRSMIFEYFGRPRAQLDPKSHQNLKKVKNVTKKGSHFGAILGHFSIKQCIKNASAFRGRVPMVFDWFWSSFWSHFDTFSLGFHALANHAFSMTLPCEINVFRSRKAWKTRQLASNFDLRSRPRFCKEIHQNLVEHGTKIDQNSIKNRIRKSMRFRTTLDSTRRGRSEAGRQAVGVGGTIQIPFNSIQILQFV